MYNSVEHLYNFKVTGAVQLRAVWQLQLELPNSDQRVSVSVSAMMLIIRITYNRTRSSTARRTRPSTAVQVDLLV